MKDETIELYQEILLHKLLHSEEWAVSVEQIVANECYQALQKIKAVLEDDNLDDTECFSRIEKIVQFFEEIGSDGGFRHDFG